MSRQSMTSSTVLGAHLWLVYAFLYVPILVLILLSFNASGLPTAWGGASLKWYAKLLANASIQHAALNTLIVALSSTFIACLLGTMPLTAAPESAAGRAAAGLALRVSWRPSWNTATACTNCCACWFKLAAAAADSSTSAAFCCVT